MYKNAFCEAPGNVEFLHMGVVINHNVRYCVFMTTAPKSVCLMTKYGGPKLSAERKKPIESARLGGMYVVHSNLLP